jgi:hypothetical protein
MRKFQSFAIGFLAALALVALPVALVANVQQKDTAAGLQIGTTVNQPIAFHGATPVVQRSSASQAAVTQTSVTVSTANATDLATSEALANSLKTQVNALVVDVAALTVLNNELRAALVAKGLIKGS